MGQPAFGQEVEDAFNHLIPLEHLLNWDMEDFRCANDKSFQRRRTTHRVLQVLKRLGTAKVPDSAERTVPRMPHKIQPGVSRSAPGDSKGHYKLHAVGSA